MLRVVEETMNEMKQAGLGEGSGWIHAPNSFHLNTHFCVSQSTQFSTLVEVHSGSSMIIKQDGEQVLSEGEKDEGAEEGRRKEKGRRT